MNKLDLATWYAEHSGQVLIVFAIPVAIAWFYYFESAEQQEPIWIIIGTVAGAYYWSKRHLKQYCYKKVSKYAEKFSKTPKFSSSTSEELIDTLDMDILVKLDEMEEEKGEYLKLISALDIVDSEEALERLGKLKSMSYVHATSRKISLTSSGVDLLNTPLIQRTLLPPKFSTVFAKAKIWYDEGNYNGVADTINILFEELLRKFLENELGDKLSDEWAKLQSEKIIRKSFDRVGLGELYSVCKYLKIIQESSVEGHMIASFLQLRIPQKHSTKKESEPQQIAKSAIELANIFIREKFQR